MAPSTYTHVAPVSAARLQWREAENLRSTTIEAPTVIACASALRALV